MEGDRQSLRKENHMDFMKYSVFHRKSVSVFWFRIKKKQMGKLRQKGSRVNHVRKSRFDNEDGKKVNTRQK